MLCIIYMIYVWKGIWLYYIPWCLRKPSVIKHFSARKCRHIHARHKKSLQKCVRGLVIRQRYQKWGHPGQTQGHRCPGVDWAPSTIGITLPKSLPWVTWLCHFFFFYCFPLLQSVYLEGIYLCAPSQFCLHNTMKGGISVQTEIVHGTQNSTKFQLSFKHCQPLPTLSALLFPWSHLVFLLPLTFGDRDENREGWSLLLPCLFQDYAVTVLQPVISWLGLRFIAHPLGQTFHPAPNTWCMINKCWETMMIQYMQEKKAKSLGSLF